MDEVRFTEADHKYEGKKGVYTSVTTVISKYKQPYNSDYWSLYKGIERYVVESKGSQYWYDKKKEHGYEKMIPYFLPKIGDTEKLEGYICDVLVEWQEKKTIACEKGTAYHKRKEEEVNGKIFDGSANLPVIVSNRNWHMLESGVYTELVMWNEDYMIAGQADKVDIEDKYVDIDDYKTSKIIEDKSFYHYITGYRMMKEPLSNIQDCNLFHYEMQLSVYGWMLEQKGFTPRRLRIYHTITDRWIVVNYRRDEVIKMLKHYRKIK